MLKEPSKSYKPFHYEWAVAASKEHAAIHWLEEEIDLSPDLADWKNGSMNEVEKHHVTNILKLFTQQDLGVSNVYYDYLIPVFKNNEIRMMLGAFASMESIHQRAYALLNDTLGLPEDSYTEFREYKEMLDKIDFIEDNEIDTDSGVAKTIVKQIFSEGVSLFGSFVMLLNYRRCKVTADGKELSSGKMPGMCTVVEYSVRDEDQHCQGGIKLFREFMNENPHLITDTFKKEIYEMARTVVALEDKFIDLAYEMGPVEGLTKEELKEYIRYLTDRRLIQIGLKGNFKVKDNPLPWVDIMINGNNHSNFFETRVTDYRKAGMIGEWGWPEEVEDEQCTTSANS